jgi:hypothetical protein
MKEIIIHNLKIFTEVINFKNPWFVGREKGQENV